MALNAKEAPGGSGNTQEPIEPGSYPARLVQVIDLGLQAQSYEGDEKPPRDEINTTYELLDEFMKDEEGEDITDKPRWLSESFPLHNLAADRAKSTQRYYALDPKEEYDGDWSKLTGIPVMLTVVINEGKGKNKGKVYNNIASISAMRSREADKAPPLVNKPLVFSLEDTSPKNLQAFHDLPQFLRDKIKKGLNFAGSDFQIALEDFKPAKKDEKNKDTKGRKAKPEVEEEEDNNDDGNW